MQNVYWNGEGSDLQVVVRGKVVFVIVFKEEDITPVQSQA